MIEFSWVTSTPGGPSTVSPQLAENGWEEEHATKFFKAEPSITEKGMKAVLCAARDLCTVTRTTEHYEKLWSGNPPIPTRVDPGISSTIDERIPNLQDQTDCKGHLYLVFLNHEIDHTAQHGLVMPLSAGIGRKTAALKIVAEHLSRDLKVIQQHYKRSRNYMYLMRQAGPGSLLELGSKVSHA